MELKLANGTVCRTQTEIKIYDLIANTLHSLEYVIVKIRMFRSGERYVLQMLIEKIDGETVTITDCEQASRQVSAILDVNESVLDNSYNLEVSSTGINRPLTRPEDFERFIGIKVRVKTLTKIDGSSLFFGIITKSDGQTVVVDNEEVQSSIAIEMENIIDANLDLEIRRTDSDRPSRGNFGDRRPSFGDRPRSGGGRPSYGSGGQRREGGRPSYGDRRPRSDGDRPSFGDRRPRSDGDRPSFGDRRPRSDGDRPSFGDRRPRSDGDRPSFGDRRPRSDGDRPSFGDRRPRSDGDRPSFGDRRPRSDGDRPSFGDRRPPRSDSGRPSFGDRRPRRDGDAPRFSSAGGGAYKRREGDVKKTFRRKSKPE